MNKAPIYEGLVKRRTIGMLPRKIAIIFGTISAVFILGLHMFWSIPFLGIVYVLLVKLYQHDSYFLEIIREHLISKDYYLP